MPIAPDHALAAILAVLFPVRAALFGFRRLANADPEDVPRVRLWLYRQGITIQWSLAAATVALWAWLRRPWGMLGVVPHPTWGLLGVSLGFAVTVLYVLAQRRKALEDDQALLRLRQRMRHIERMMPRSAAELRWFGGLAVTAGMCEELLYRGYLTWYLASAMPLVPAVLLSSVVFGVGHAYQGPRGVATTAAVGVFFCGIYIVTGSLLACMAIHALMDLYAGQMAKAAFAREEPGPAATVLESVAGR